jgi:nucleotide-binding universal stress UspA family protein
LYDCCWHERSRDDLCLLLTVVFKEQENAAENERGRQMIPQIKKILYATDLSKNSSYAFLFATDMARRHDAKIVILHVLESIPPYAESYSGITDEMKRKQQEETVEELKKHLQEFCKKAEAQIGSPCAELVYKILVPRGHPPEEILNAANEEGCDVIVLGTHGKGFLAHTFLGSVSNAVLHRARKPVFIIPLPAEKTIFDLDSV